MGDSEIELGVYASGNVQPIVLQTKHLSYRVTVPDKSKPRRCMGILSRPTKTRLILDDVNMLARPGELTAIMGPSGGGKTTLLDVISSRISGKVSGDLLMNGEPITMSSMSKVAGYVRQKDILLASATVRECIADLRLPSSLSSEEKHDRVERVIEKLGLTKCADTKVGDDTKRGVSGGELKRTAIGVELVTQPNLLFLDEPTSGLDSSSAYTIVDILRRLSREDGTTVICTIHQPRANIFNMFDRLILLQTGRILFQGPPQEALPFFAECGHPCPEYTNPADFFMDIITNTTISSDFPTVTANFSSVDSEDTLLPGDCPPSPSPSPSPPIASVSTSDSSPISETPESHLPKLFADGESEASSTPESLPVAEPAKAPLSIDEMVSHWRQSKKSRRVVKYKEGIVPLDTKRRMNRKPGWVRQTWTLFGRSWRNNIRNPMIMWAQLAQHVILSLFIGFMYLNIGKKDNSQMDRVAAVFFCMLNASWIPSLTATFVFPAERPLFNRERSGGFYKTLPYYLTTTLSDFPLQLLFTIINCALSYWMLGLRATFTHFIIFTAIMFLCIIATQSLALFISALSPSPSVANSTAGIIIMLLMAFGGYILSTKNVPPYFYPVQYSSPYRYGFRALMQNDLLGVHFPCTPTPIPCPPGNYTIISGPNLNETHSGPLVDDGTQRCTSPCLLTTGELVLQVFGLTGSGTLQDSMIVLGIIVITRVGIFLALQFVQVGSS